MQEQDFMYAVTLDPNGEILGKFYNLSEAIDFAFDKIYEGNNWEKDYTLDRIRYYTAEEDRDEKFTYMEIYSGIFCRTLAYIYIVGV